MIYKKVGISIIVVLLSVIGTMVYDTTYTIWPIFAALIALVFSAILSLAAFAFLYNLPRLDNVKTLAVIIFTSIIVSFTTETSAASIAIFVVTFTVFLSYLFLHNVFLRIIHTSNV